MAGNKQYDRIELLDRAIELFRHQGFTATSTADLVETLGVNRKSMYAEFGSKQGLFEAALQRYNDHHLSRVLAAIEAPDAGVGEIREAFANYASASRGWARGRGCLLCNTAVERAPLDQAVQRHVEAYFDRLNRAFGDALGNAQRNGALDPRADLDELAAFLTMALVGVAALIRAEASPSLIDSATRVTLLALDGHTADDRLTETGPSSPPPAHRPLR